VTGRTLVADQAHEWGLVSEVVDDDLLPHRAKAVTTREAQDLIQQFAGT
jgi:enoyl-CoA hydratase/carnithine racemase